MATCPLKPNVKMIITKTFELYLRNTSDTDVQLTAGELFGYGLRSYSEVGLGRAVEARARCCWRCRANKC